jgi:hypothetical protein
MHYHTVKELVRSLAARNCLPTHWPKPDVIDLSVGPAKAPRHMMSKLDRGIELHEALDRRNRGEWIDAEYWPFARTIRSWLDGFGPERILTNWDVTRPDLHGQPDYFIIGGSLNRRGVVEVKVVSTGLPEHPRPKDVLQLSLYPVADNGTYDNFFGVLAYIAFETGEIRLFVWESLASCCHDARARWQWFEKHAHRRRYTHWPVRKAA